MLASGSHPDPASRQPRTSLRSAYRWAVIALLVIIAGEIFLSSRQQSQVFDEADHLYAGYEYWKHGDFGRNPEHPPLMKLVAASALLRLPLKEPTPVLGPWLISSWIRNGVLTASIVPPTISGTVILSASELDGQIWGPDVMNPYNQFSHLRPDAMPGNIILVYHGTFDVPLLSAYSHSAAADRLAAKHELPEAVAEAEEAVRLAPDSADIQAALGRTLMAAGRTQEAQQANTKALQIARSVHPDFQQPLIKRLEATATPPK
jgi:hypothetical protein